jgi:hypothetical protein
MAGLITARTSSSFYAGRSAGSPTPTLGFTMFLFSVATRSSQGCSSVRSFLIRHRDWRLVAPKTNLEFMIQASSRWKVTLEEG